MNTYYYFKIKHLVILTNFKLKVDAGYNLKKISSLETHFRKICKACEFIILLCEMKINARNLLCPATGMLTNQAKLHIHFHYYKLHVTNSHFQNFTNISQMSLTKVN
jgi:hypothetical protein